MEVDLFGIASALKAESSELGSPHGPVSVSASARALVELKGAAVTSGGGDTTVDLAGHNSLLKSEFRRVSSQGGSGFVQALTNRLDEAGCQHRKLTSPVPLGVLASMRVGAVVVNPTILGPLALSYLEQLRARRPQLGIVVCTGPSSVAQRVRGLRAGADDWVTKPCHPLEVIARVEAVVRRRKRADVSAAPAPKVIGELEIRADLYQAFVGGVSIDLTRREFELLELLAAADGQVLERDEIYERVWGYALVHGDRSVDVYVRKLRRKLESSSPGWRYIHTHFGIGYRLACEPVTAPESVRPRAAPISRRPAAALAVAGGD